MDATLLVMRHAMADVWANASGGAYSCDASGHRGSGVGVFSHTVPTTDRPVPVPSTDLLQKCGRQFTPTLLHQNRDREYQA